MSANIRAGLEVGLKALNLPTFLSQYALMAQQALEHKTTCEQYLYSLVELEVQEKHQRRIKSLLKGAKFPLTKTIDQYNFDEAEGVCQQQINELCAGNFVHDAKNIVIYGLPGTGKTHLAIGIGRELCLKGVKVLFITACDLVQELIKAKNNLSLSNYLKRLRRYQIICIDELGFIPFEKHESDLLFQFFSDRYEKGSVLITTNLVFSEWDRIFKDTATTTAVIDRIIHHSIIFELNSESYRTKEAKKNLTKKSKS